MTFGVYAAFISSGRFVFETLRPINFRLPDFPRSVIFFKWLILDFPECSLFPLAEHIHVWAKKCQMASRKTTKLKRNAVTKIYGHS